MKFTHLHVHSHYSLLDGLPKIDELLDYVKELGMDSVALTDHGVMYGAVEFYKKAKAKGIKPIIGCEIYTAFERMEDKRPNIDSKRYHLILLAKNEQGYKNLVKLVTKANLEGFYYKPRIDDELLSKHSEGLIGLSACVQGKIPRLLLSGQLEQAEELAKKYEGFFGKGNFYLEIQHHPNIPEQKIANERIIALSKKTGIPLVATNDIHYLKQEDADAQDVLMLINTGADANDPERLTMKGSDFSMFSPEKMEELFKDTPSALENTQKIADACNFNFELGKTKLPDFPVPKGKTADQYLRDLTYNGLEKRFGKNPHPHTKRNDDIAEIINKDDYRSGVGASKKVIERLDYELAIIKKTGYAGYFLIVQDFVNWAKQNRIVVGPGRGSAGGSLVAYLTNITNVDPLKHDLLFERFLNPERISMPDIDLDFADRRRDEVLKYVSQKYGEDHVSQIITFGTMAARAVIRDVGRALNYTYSYCDQMAKMIPIGMDLSETLEKVSEFSDLYKSDLQAKKLIDLAKKLEGVARHASTHACGVVISADPLTDLVPLQRPTQENGNIISQYEMHGIEDLGLLKMDFLGLKNLTIIEDTLARIYVLRKGLKIDIENIPFDDIKTYKLLQEALTTSVFQMESDGFKRYLKELKPTVFEDLIAMVALYRPGPMQFIPDYIERKHGKQEIKYLHPKLEPILKETYNICIYQEQLMKIAQEICGFSLGEADVLRKAVGKKIKELLDAQEQKFISGAIKNGVDKKIAEELWQWILPFASYGFNKCLTGDTKIFDSETGKLIEIKEIEKNKKLLPKTLSLDENLKIKKTNAIEFLKNGVKPVFEIKTKSGKKIKATKNHPFYTQFGWKNLQEIHIKDRIAVPRFIPEPTKPINVKNHKIIVLGYLLAEGNLCHPSGFYFYSKSKDEIKDYVLNLEKFKNTLGRTNLYNKKTATEVYSKRKNKKKQSEAVEWINKLNLKGKKATEKIFPEFVFSLSNKKLALLIGKMFQGDGCINLKRAYPQIFYATSSKYIAESLQHLLLRFGIVSTNHKKRFKYRDGIKIGYTLNINRYDNIQKFAYHFKKHLLGDKASILEKIEKTHPIINGSLKTWSARGSKDIIPKNIILPIIRNEVKDRNLVFAQVAKQNEFSERLFINDFRKIGFLRETVDVFCRAFKNDELEKYAHSDIFWDEIVSITPKGKEETFDLSIKDTHNFVANDIFVHNSHSAAYATIAYQTAYLKAHYPVEFMASVLTSEKADIERISFLIDECKKMEVEVLPPNINESLKNFTVVPNENKIRFGLLAVKNVGTNIIDAIVEERKNNGQFTSITDFIYRVKSKDLNKKSMEALIKAGAFDALAERNRLLVNLEKLLEIARENNKSKQTNQIGLFENIKISNNEIKLDEAKPASNFEKLGWEKELLGLYVSSHPLYSFRKIFEKRAMAISKIDESYIDKKIILGGIISNVKKIITKNGKPMLFMKLEDLTSKIEIVIFPNLLERNPSALQENKIVFVAGRVDNRNNEIKIIADDVQEILRHTD